MDIISNAKKPIKKFKPLVTSVKRLSSRLLETTSLFIPCLGIFHEFLSNFLIVNENIMFNAPS